MNLRLPCVLVFCTGVMAQNQWIVDINNGPGTHFAQVNAALASSQVVDGDVLLVRSGAYGEFATSKGVAILCEGTVTFAVTPGVAVSATITLQSVAAGRTFALANATVQHDCTNARSAILMQNNQGRVHFENVHTRGIGYPTWILPFCSAVTIVNSALVSWNQGSVLGAGGIFTADSTLALARVAAEGLRGSDLTIRTISSTPALSVRSSAVLLAETDLRGGNGDRNVAPSAGLSVLLPGGAAIDLAGSGLNFVVAGIGSSVPAPGIRLDGGTLTYDPSITIAGANGGPPIAGAGSTIARPLARVAGAGAALGGTVQNSVTSPPGNGFFLALSLPTLPQPTSLGPLFLDLSTMITLAFGVQGASGTTSVPLPVPNNGALRGLALCVQAADGAAGAAVRLTNPVIVVIR